MGSCGGYLWKAVRGEGLGSWGFGCVLGGAQGRGLCVAVIGAWVGVHLVGYMGVYLGGGGFSSSSLISTKNFKINNKCLSKRNTKRT